MNAPDNEPEEVDISELPEIEGWFVQFLPLCLKITVPSRVAQAKKMETQTPSVTIKSQEEG